MFLITNKKSLSFSSPALCLDSKHIHYQYHWDEKIRYPNLLTTFYDLHQEIPTIHIMHVALLFFFFFGIISNFELTMGVNENDKDSIYSFMILSGASSSNYL